MWSLGLVSVMRRAAAFCTRCKRLVVDLARAASTALQSSSQLSTSAVIGRLVTDLTQTPQLKEATADNTTDVLLHRQLIVEVDTEICTTVTGWMILLLTESVRSADDNLRRLA